MNCKFCNQFIGDLIDNTILLSCEPCHARYSYLSDHTLYGYAFDHYDGNVLYSALFYSQTNKFEIMYTDIHNQEWNPPILKLDFHPDIKPHNFISKLKTYLTFL